MSEPLQDAAEVELPPDPCEISEHAWNMDGICILCGHSPDWQAA